MKKIIAFFILFALICAPVCAYSQNRGISSYKNKEISASIDSLIQKTYAKELFSPEDYELMMSYKLLLDAQKDKSSYSENYKKLAKLFELREMPDEAKECLKNVI